MTKYCLCCGKEISQPLQNENQKSFCSYHEKMQSLKQRYYDKKKIESSRIYKTVLSGNKDLRNIKLSDKIEI